MSAKKQNKSNQSARKNRWASFFRGVLIFFTLLASLGLIVASYGGDIAPDKIRGICLMVMTFPLWAMFMIFMTVLDAIWCKKALVICLLTYIACGTALWEFSPLNIFTPDEDDYPSDRKFSVMTYNICNFSTRNGEYPNGQNPSISFILRENADIVCLQEAQGIHASAYGVKISSQQIDSLNKVYPYIYLYGHSQMLLSKYPAKLIPSGKKRPGSNEIAIFQLKVEGLPITLINVHLRSYGLTSDDKLFYREITELNTGEESIKEEMLNIKSQLLRKIQDAAELRAEEAERIGEYIRRFGGPNVILVGDFNDVPGCYTLRRMRDFEMRQVYEDVGFGPMITYFDNRFYFRIDHMLYRGNLEPLDMDRPSHDSSDHSPLIATFAIENKH